MSDTSSGASADADLALVETAYDPGLLRKAAHWMVDHLCEHLANVHTQHERVHNWRPPEENIADAAAFMRAGDRVEGLDPARLSARLRVLVETTLERGQNLQHPLYIGHQVPAPSPLAGLFEMAMAVTNQIQGVYEMGPWAVATERAVLDAIGQEIGFAADSFGGVITSGGSLANLTALLTARNQTLSGCWRQGVASPRPHGSAPPVLVVHQEAHYCIDRAAGVLGLGTDQLVRVALDAQRRMDPGQLDQVLTDLCQRGAPVVAVVAVAGATPTGAFDPLPAIADVCRRQGVWLHVDAAHGGAACLSDRHRHLVEGLALADSVVMDAHKMMFVPALCALVFYRDKAHRFAAFQQSAPYLFDPSTPGMAEYDNAMVTMECSKRAVAMGVWTLWSLFGKRVFAAMVDTVFQTAKDFHELLEEHPRFEVVAEPKANILVFRYLPEHAQDFSNEQLDQLQLRIRRTLLQRGDLYITQTKLEGRLSLRATVMNPLTRKTHLQKALMELAAEGQRQVESLAGLG